MLAANPRTCSCGTVVLYSNTESQEHVRLHLPTCVHSEPAQQRNSENAVKVKIEAKDSLDSITTAQITSDHINSNNVLFECTLCTSLNISPQSFGLHLKQQHNVKEPFKCSRCQSTFTALLSLTTHMDYRCYKIHKCTICNDTFESQADMKCHKNKEHFKKWCCTYCSECFGLKAHLLAHQRIHKRFSCKVCGEVFSTPQSLGGHSRIHIHKERFACEECDKAFKTPYMLKWHWTSHAANPTEKEVGSFTCGECNEALSSKTQLQQHIESCHPPKTSSCKECGKVCLTPYELKLHSRIHANRGEVFTCKECNTAFDKICLLKVHLKTHVAKPYKCSICFRTFTTEQLYQYHQKSARCQACKQCFGRFSGLRKHLRSGAHRSKETPFVVCGYCGSKLETLELWEKHITEHRGKGIHKCICGRRFHEKLQFEEHQKSSFCKDCNKCFDQPFELKAHLRSPSHSSEKILTSEKNNTEHQGIEVYHCDFCGRAFHDKTLHDIHQNSLQCKECKKCFITRSGLTTHLRSVAHLSTQQRSSETDSAMYQEVVLFKCDLCERTFHDKHLHEIHQNNSQCKECKKCFNTSSELKEHMESSPRSLEKQRSSEKENTEHDEIELYKCDICRRGFEDKYMYELHEKTSQCKECKRCFHSSLEMKAHLASRAHPTEKPYSCEQCGKQFRKQFQALLHAKRDRNKQIYQCNKCKKAFVSASNYEKHNCWRTPYECTVCSAAFKWPSDLDKHSRVHNPNRSRLQCPKCHKSYCTQSKLRAHLSLHDGTSRHKCHQCNKNFVCNAHLKDHLETHNPNRKEFKCDICEKIYASELGLKGHLKVHKEGQQSGQQGNNLRFKRHFGVHTRYTCKHCNRVFKYPTRLKSHLRIHSSETPIYKCSECGKTYGCRTNFAAHLGEHPGRGAYNVMDLKPFKCNECVMRFRDKARLTKHQKWHIPTPYKCDQCNRYFSGRSILEYHLPVHSNNRPHTCNLCGATFKWKYGLRKHLTLHDDWKYSCENCKKGFVSFKELHRHVRKLCKSKNKLTPRCEHCGKRFIFRVSLIKHLRDVHGDLKPYPCSECGRTFRHSIHLTSHQFIHKGEKAHTCRCGKGFAHETAFKLHLKTKKVITDADNGHESITTNSTSETVNPSGQGTKKHRCKHCEKCLASGSNLKRHLREVHGDLKNNLPGTYNRRTFHLRPNLVHKDEKQHTCECGKSFTHKTALKLHLKTKEFYNEPGQKDNGITKEVIKDSIAKEIKANKCEHCGELFASKFTLLKHLREVHTHSKPHSCSECSRVFRHPDYLTSHGLVHKSKKPHICKCGKSFTHKTALKLHLKTKKLKIELGHKENNNDIVKETTKNSEQETTTNE